MFVSLVVLLTTKMTAQVLKKYITARTKGKLIEELGDGKYLVEFETDEGNFQLFIDIFLLIFV